MTSSLGIDILLAVLVTMLLLQLGLVPSKAGRGSSRSAPPE
jgi:hypothetical protein